MANMDNCCTCLIYNFTVMTMREKDLGLERERQRERERERKRERIICMQSPKCITILLHLQNNIHYISKHCHIVITLHVRGGGEGWNFI